MKSLLTRYCLIAAMIVSGCSSDDDMEPEEDLIAEIPSEFLATADGIELFTKGEFSGRIGNESFTAELKSVMYTDFQGIPGITYKMVSLVGMVLKPDRNEMIFISLTSFSNDIIAGVTYGNSSDETFVGLHSVGSDDDYVSRLVNEVELTFQKLDVGSGLASGSVKGNLLSEESDQPLGTVELSFENIELVKVEESIGS
ncbi:hypothetical protein [Cyclobacterium xiamenense]|uniref:hypothetical protein n=1 Tax=Cyclobacterium xiamenense TaxID=1297121 RepID=UPI0012B6D5AD|nr:hypothetical protein [Cyclobacterium xiamenense]